MKGWAELKEAFWAAAEGGPEERARQIAALASIDPALSRRLEALLAADERGEPLGHLFAKEPVPVVAPERIGGYEVVGILGVGGMGEVYRARDARLEREVAIKVLPRAATKDEKRLARFEREARVLASLNHPNIAQVYGLDEFGGSPALVMELVAGPTLAELIAASPEKPITPTRALTIARQIVDGLDAAHEKGIVHRDLKPSNVALTGEGVVRILDFGIAKSLEAGPATGPGAPAATGVGLVIGTPAYVSPEQARGSPVDKRTDIWAFGCVLYELLTGRRAFGGDTASDSIAAVLERDPDMSRLPAATPPAVVSLLRHCLEKDPRRRLRDIADARLAIDDALHPTPDPRSRRDSGDIAPRPADRGVRVRWLLAGAALTALAAVVVSQLPLGLEPKPAPRGRTITSIVLPRGMSLSGGGNEVEAHGSEIRFAVSPDGRRLALLAAHEPGRAQLWLRDLGSPAFQPVPETEGASFPFWSADSESIGFVAAGRLKAVRLSDGSTRTLSDGAFRVGGWSRDGRILFAPARSSPLHVVPAEGGAPRRVTTLDQAGGEVHHESPAFLPDGRRFLYVSIGTKGAALEPRGICLGSLDSSEPARLLLPRVTQARYASGHLLFVQDGTLMAQPFDAASGRLHAAPLPLVEDVKLSRAGATGATAAFSVSDNGVLVYQAALRTESRPVWFDRGGRQLAAIAAPADYGEVALSPDGTRMAVSVMDPVLSTRDLWVYELAGGRGQRVTVDPADDFAPVWSPDGARLAFSSAANDRVNLRVKDVDTPGDPAPLEVDSLGLGRYASDWSDDGRHLMYVAGGRTIARSDLWVAPLSSSRDARPVVESGFVETHGQFAPRAPWFAYVSNETGRLEVYVDRYPGLRRRRLVSTNGGRWPRWSRDGTELFYVSPENQLMAVAVRATPDRMEIGVPRPLFKILPRPAVRLDAYPYDVAPDAQRFVVNTVLEDATESAITVMLDWTDGLTKRQ